MRTVLFTVNYGKVVKVGKVDKVAMVDYSSRSSGRSVHVAPVGERSSTD